MPVAGGQGAGCGVQCGDGGRDGSAARIRDVRRLARWTGGSLGGGGSQGQPKRHTIDCFTTHPPLPSSQGGGCWLGSASWIRRHPPPFGGILIKSRHQTKREFQGKQKGELAHEYNSSCGGRGGLGWLGGCWLVSGRLAGHPPPGVFVFFSKRVAVATIRLSSLPGRPVCVLLLPLPPPPPLLLSFSFDLGPRAIPASGGAGEPGCSGWGHMAW